VEAAITNYQFALLTAELQLDFQQALVISKTCLKQKLV
jgi:hypothetical protein